MAAGWSVTQMFRYVLNQWYLCYDSVAITNKLIRNKLVIKISIKFVVYIYTLSWLEIT